MCFHASPALGREEPMCCHASPALGRLEPMCIHASPHRSFPGASWGLLGLPGASWSLLGPPEAFWGVLGRPGASWGLLGPPGLSWGLLGPPGVSWALLRPPGASWDLLGPPGPQTHVGYALRARIFTCAEANDLMLDIPQGALSSSGHARRACSSKMCPAPCDLSIAISKTSVSLGTSSIFNSPALFPLVIYRKRNPPAHLPSKPGVNS